MDTNSKSSQHSVKLGAFGRDVSEAVEEIINHAYEDIASLVCAELTIPKGYVKLPDETETVTKKPDTIQEKLCTALAAAIPAATAATGVALNAPAAAVVLLAGGGGVAGAFIQRSNKAAPVDLEPLTSDDIPVHIAVDREKLKKAKQESLKELERLKLRVGSFEAKHNEMHDMSMDRGFGEWAQEFLVYAAKNPEDFALQALMGRFMQRLSAMGLQVYDEVRLKEDGTPDVPIQHYLIDSKEGAEYTEVVRPAIYSDKSLLARGEIR